jgi:hypothetical protein
MSKLNPKDLDKVLTDAEQLVVESKINEVLQKNGIDRDEVGKISRVSVSTYQTVTKGEDGEPVINDLEAVKVVLHPSWEAGPQWEIIRPATPVEVKLPWKPQVKQKSETDLKCAFILPDPQIGYRKYEDGTLDPFHDDQAIDVALQIMAFVQEKYGIDVVINLGDFLDLPEHSKFIQEAAFAGTTQLAINYGHEFLAKQRAISPEARIVLLEGNHDNRLNLYATRNAQASYGLKKAGDINGDPVLSVQNLLCLKELNVEFYDKYPSQESMVWLGKYLRAMHGNKVRSNGNTAVAYTNDTPSSINYFWSYSPYRNAVQRLLTMLMVQSVVFHLAQDVYAVLTVQFQGLTQESVEMVVQELTMRTGNKEWLWFGTTKTQDVSQLTQFISSKDMLFTKVKNFEVLIPQRNAFQFQI